MLLKVKTGYIQTDEGGVNTQYKSNRKQKMGTYAVNIYGWLMYKLTVPHTNTNAVFILTVTIPNWRFMIFNIDMMCPIIQRQRY
jgi:hypothetical protein